MASLRGMSEGPLDDRRAEVMKEVAERQSAGTMPRTSDEIVEFLVPQLKKKKAPVEVGEDLDVKVETEGDSMPKSDLDLDPGVKPDLVSGDEDDDNDIGSLYEEKNRDVLHNLEDKLFSGEPFAKDTNSKFLKKLLLDSHLGADYVKRQLLKRLGREDAPDVYLHTNVPGKVSLVSELLSSLGGSDGA